MGMERKFETAQIVRGARRFLGDSGFESLQEFSPARGLRADLLALSRSGEVWIVEVKSGLEDFRADRKWESYREWCDRLYFAVGARFPIEVLPDSVGVIQADAYDAAILRPAEAHTLAAARRRALTLRFARDAAARLRRLEDPPPG